MDNVKVNLTVILLGGVQYNEKECLKAVETEQGIKEVPDLDKLERNSLSLVGEDGKRETVHFFTKKCKPIKRTLNLSEEAYNSMTDKDDMPADFKDPTRQSSNAYAWRNMSKEQRLFWHLQQIAKDLGGKVFDYHIFED
jgi:hypothetical protein